MSHGRRGGPAWPWAVWVLGACMQVACGSPNTGQGPEDTTTTTGGGGGGTTTGTTGGSGGTYTLTVSQGPTAVVDAGATLGSVQVQIRRNRTLDTTQTTAVTVALNGNTTATLGG